MACLHIFIVLEACDGPLLFAMHSTILRPVSMIVFATRFGHVYLFCHRRYMPCCTIELNNGAHLAIVAVIKLVLKLCVHLAT